MKHFNISLLLVLTCVSCGNGDTAQREMPLSTMQAPPPPPPTPYPPGYDKPIRAAALAEGAGTCKEDVPRIKIMPIGGFFGWDKHYDRIMVHGPAYKNCLVEMVLDATSIPDPGQGPKRHPYSLGALAYDLLSETGSISYGDCIPAEVMHRFEISGSVNIYRWLDIREHREQLQSCLASKLAGT